MWRKHFILFLMPVFFQGLCFSVKSQERDVSDYTKELNITFSANDEKKLEKSIKELVSADQEMAKIESIFSELTELELKEKISDKYENALKELKDLSALYNEANLSVYQIFKDKSDEFWTRMKKVQHFAAGVEKGKYYESQARKHLAMARQRRDQVLWTDRYEYARVKMKEAGELENEAIRDQGRALQVYTDYPVEYNYGWDNDITLEEISELYKNPAVNEPPEDIYATVDPQVKIDTQLMKEIIFKVQIAAHTVPLTEEYLRTIYKGGMPIDMIYEDEWYKYSIGRYKTFEKAEKTLEACKVRKAFIVAYQGGKKLTIKEALELMGELQ